MFECHVTVGYVSPFAMAHDVLKQVSESYGFRVAKLYKWNKQLSDLDTFMTGHDSDYLVMKDKMTQLVLGLGKHDFKVTRYKIEQILLDSKNGDSI